MADETNNVCNTSEVYDKLSSLQAKTTEFEANAVRQLITLNNEAIAFPAIGNAAPPLTLADMGMPSESKAVSPDKPSTSFKDTIDLSGKPDLSLAAFVLSTLPNPVDFTAEEPELDYPSRVDPLDAQPPDEISLDDIDIPDPFTYSLPPPPSYTSINIPTITNVDFSGLLSDIASLYASRPQLTNAQVDNYLKPIETHAANLNLSANSIEMMNLFDNRMLNNNLFTTEDNIIDVMQEIVSGNRELGLPSFVEDQMFSSARSRADAELLMAQQEAFTDMSARGFSLPSGVLVYRLDTATQQALLKKKDLNRDLVILHYQEKLKEFWNAVQTVTGLSNQRFSLYVQLIDLGFKKAEVMSSVLFQAVQARAALLQAQIAVFNSAIEIFNSRIRVELAQLEKDKLRLEAAQLEASIRELDIRVYVERLRAIQVEADIFRTTMESARIRLEAEGLKVQNYSAQVNAYNGLVQAKKSEYEAYGEEVRAEVAKIQVYESQVRAYGERVRAYAEEANTKLKGDELRIRVRENDISIFEANLAAYRETIAARVQQLQAKISKLTAETGLYGEDVKLAVENARLPLERVSRLLDYFAAASDINKFNTDQNNQRVREIYAQKNAVEKGIFDFYQNIAAAALSAMDIAATVSSQCQESVSINTNL